MPLVSGWVLSGAAAAGATAQPAAGTQPIAASQAAGPLATQPAAEPLVTAQGAGRKLFQV